MGLNEHGYTPKKRNSNSRKRKKIIFIATEGKNKTENAAQNAKRLEKYNLQSGKKLHTVEFMPSTEVYRIFETIMEAETV